MDQSSPSEPVVANPMQPVLDLVTSLIASAQAIDAFIDKQPNPYSQECQILREKEQAIVDSGTALSNLAMQEITRSIAYAVAHLKSNIDAANATIQEISNATKAIGIASALMAAAAGIASAGVLAAVPAIVTLATAVSSATIG